MQAQVNENVRKLCANIGMIVFAVIAFIKFTRVYDTINLSEYSVIFAFSTLTFLSSIFLVLKCFFPKCSYVFLVIIYSFVSIVMLIDCLYFSYNNKLTTIGNINLIWQLKAVEDSITAINPLKFWWIVVDVPIIIIYMIFIHKKICEFISKKITKDIRLKGLKIINIVLVAALIIANTFYCYVVDFKLRYLSMESIIYHVSDIFDALINDDEQIDYEKYLNSKEVKIDENYGIANGKNVVIIQVEALQSFVLGKYYNGQEITPFLNSLISDSSFYFENHFYQVGAGNTSDAEFTVNNSLLASSEDSVYTTYYDNEYYGLPYILKDNGYAETSVFHAYDKEYWNRNTAYINQGFDNFYSMDDFSNTEVIGLGASDEQFLLEAANIMEEMQEPFYSFLITLSSHHPFYLPEEYVNMELEEEHEETLFGMYVESVNYVDRALECFFDKMKEKGLYENSIFVIYGDHFAIPNYNTQNAEFASELIGHDYTYVDMFRVPFIVHVPEKESAETLDIVSGHVDILPTLLHLLGINNDKAIMMGSDLFSVQDNIVYQQMHVGKGSFISKDVFYYSSNSGIEIYNKAFDLETGKEIEITNEMINQSRLAKETIRDAKVILKKNLALLNH